MAVATVETVPFMMIIKSSLRINEVIIMMNDKELNNKIDEIIKPFMVKSINRSLRYNEDETVDPELLMSCSFETLDMILLG